jgi:hypothetical protein
MLAFAIAVLLGEAVPDGIEVFELCAVKPRVAIHAVKDTVFVDVEFCAGGGESDCCVSNHFVQIAFERLVTQTVEVVIVGTKHPFARFDHGALLRPLSIDPFNDGVSDLIWIIHFAFQVELATLRTRVTKVAKVAQMARPSEVDLLSSCCAVSGD